VDGPDRRERLARARLYLVLEARPHGEDPQALLDAALRGGVDVVQLREKGLEDNALIAAAAPFRAALPEALGGRSMIGVRSVPRRSTSSSTTSPILRYFPSSAPQPFTTVPEAMTSPA